MLKLKLEKGEKLIHTKRGSMLPHTFYTSVGTTLLIVPFFFFFPLLAFGKIGISLLLTVVAMGLVVLLRTATKWKTYACILTDRRIIRTKSSHLFDTQISYAKYTDIDDVAYKISGLLGKLTRVGVVKVSFRGILPDMIFSSMNNPEILAEIISELRDTTQ